MASPPAEAYPFAAVLEPEDSPSSRYTRATRLWFTTRPLRCNRVCNRGLSTRRRSSARPRRRRRNSTLQSCPDGRLKVRRFISISWQPAALKNVHLDGVTHGQALLGGLYLLFPRISLSTWMFRGCFATSRFRRWFSSSIRLK